ncbi:MAG: tetratricopeptide repeat-containing protein, partial [Flavobacterium sp.]|uniref:tetratricopeptide repeat-containing protein n=1 Tax=Flavobacterium sp. TaxID=239 RepID=UPI00326375CA
KDKDKPGKFFTHVHILAHGGKIDQEFSDFEFGIIFGKAGAIPTPTESIKKLWDNINNKPFLVNYMICDGANFSNPMTSDKNPVQVTHRAGVPIVLGSQFPLSMLGSVLITKKLYSALFRGIDIREILYDIRIALFDLGPSMHDWISLVSYIRLPEGYNDYLFTASLRLLSAELKYIRLQTEQYLNNNRRNDDAFLTNRHLLLDCITLLEHKMKQISGNKKYEQEELENLGLLGSAYKRMAELFFIKMKTNGQKKSEEITEQKSFLKKALGYYKQACDKNLSHHWSIVQYLSLDIVLNGKVTSPEYLYVAKKSIDIAIENKPDSWCYGSLLELYLLQQNSGSEMRNNALNIVTELIKKASQEKDSYPIESAFNQINRYQTWWTPDFDFPILKDVLMADSSLICEILENLSVGKKDIDTAITIDAGV